MDDASIATFHGVARTIAHRRMLSLNIMKEITLRNMEGGGEKKLSCFRASGITITSLCSAETGNSHGKTI
jgi:hypothetical protein